ncbi:hypothetical protein ACRJ4B_25785 [Streptomyces sp. GTA36]
MLNVAQGPYRVVHLVLEAAEALRKGYLMPRHLLVLRGVVDLITSRAPSDD